MTKPDLSQTENFLWLQHSDEAPGHLTIWVESNRKLRWASLARSWLQELLDTYVYSTSSVDPLTLWRKVTCQDDLKMPGR